MHTVNVKNDITNFIEQINTKNPTQKQLMITINILLKY